MAEDAEKKTVSKLNIDRPQDFKFHVAYDVYSRAWDDNSSEEARSKLNELISSLSEGQSDYSSFYSQINEYRKDVNFFRPGRTRITTLTKKKWSRRDAQDRRNRRHR